MFKGTMKRFSSLIMAVVMVFGVLVATPIKVHAANLTTDVEGLTVSYNNGTWTATGTTLSGSATGKAQSSCGSASSETSTLTLKNSKGTPALISFDYAKPTLGSGGSVSIDGSAVSAAGFFSKQLAANESVTVVIVSGSAGAYTSSIVLSNLSLVAETNVTMTFKVPQGNGSYTLNGTAITATTTITQNSTTAYNLIATPASGYKLEGWYNETTQKFVNTTANWTAYFESAATIYPVFIPTTVPVWDVGNNWFTDLNAAIQYSQNNNKNTIILISNGTLSSGNYTIPNGKTVLIPFDDVNTIYGSTPEYYESTSAYSAPSAAFRTLTMAGATITVANGGTLNISSKIHRQGLGSVGPYGRIAMDAASNIIVKSGGKFYAWGFVTGSGKVTVESGGNIWESMAGLDYPGSASTAKSIYEAGAFPLRTYTVRNVEPELCLFSGATEIIHTHLYGTTAGEFPISFSFVGNSTAAFFYMTSGTLTKNISGNVTYITVDGNASINPMGMNLAGVSVSTKQTSGVPIPGGYVITLANGTITLNESVLLQENTRLNINNGAELNISSGKKLYVFDGTDDVYSNATSDAVMDINGTVNVTGAFYTTENHAQIISSNKTGTVQLNSAAGTATSVTYKKAKSAAGSAVITAASLLNGDGSYTETAGAAANTTYFYCPICNKWETEHTGPAAYTITWKNDDGTVLKTEMVEEGTVPSYSGSTPTKEATAQYTYTFSGWTPTPVAATADATYTATYSSTVNKYTVTWKNEDGTVLETDTNVPYGTTPTYDGPTPAKAPDTAHEYVFSTWTPSIAPVAGNVTYTAVFTTQDHTPAAAIHENETPATCTAEGHYDEVVKCAVCGTELSRTTKTTPALGHNYGEWTETKAPTCTEKGSETRTCSRCGETETREVAALGHALVHHEAKSATCTAIGWDAYDTCSRCDYTTYVEIAATGHTEGEAKIENNVDATCTTAGSFDEVVYCTVCGAELHREHKTSEALGHAFGEWTETKAPTCTEKGTETRTCSRCGETETREVAALGHDLIHHEAKAATCTAIGWNAYDTCSRCDYTTYVEIAATGHTDGTPVKENDYPATCTVAGSYDMVVYCSACGVEMDRETIIVDPLGHDMTAHAAVAATCEDDGNSAYWSCSRCGKYFSDANGENVITANSWVIDALGHNWDYANAVFNWNGQECQTATVKCTRDASHETTVNVTVTAAAGTGDDEGYWIYTASFTAGGQTYTDVKKVEGHYHDGILFKPWNNATSLPTEAGHYYLTCDVTLSSKWYAAPGVTDLCLNGHSITGQTELAGDDPEQVVLDLYDCENTGKLTVSGGTLLNISSNATFNMYGGSVSGCDHSGECIRVMFDTSVFNMYAGSVKNNKGSYIVNGAGHFNMYGGTISNNTGIGVNVANFSISGSPVIRNNKVTSGGTETEKNVWFMALSKIEIAGELTEDADIGITLNRTLTCDAPYVFTNGLSGKGDASAFTSDQGYLIRVNNDGEAELYIEHSWGEWTVTTPATCTEEGVETRECSVCHETETRPVTALGHTEEVMPAVPATCTATGLTEGKRCSVCGEILVAQQETPALGHEWDYAHAVFNWNGQECTTATVKCSRDANHEMTVNVTVIESAGTGDDEGYWVYTASFTAGGQTYTDVKKVEGHYHDGILFKVWNKTASLPTAAGSYYLTADVTLNSTWNVPTGTVNLCLNGHTVRLAEGKTGSVINIAKEATLSIYDHNDAGMITGGNQSSRSGGGVLVSGTFKMYGGNITGNSASQGGGVYVGTSSAAFTLYGGSIHGNTASSSGGGVYVSFGNFEMNGGSIAGNTADYGAGVYMEADSARFTMTGGSVSENTAVTSAGGIFSWGRFTMTGGSVTENTAPDAGVILRSGSVTKISGDPQINGNTNGNVYLIDDGIRIVVNGTLSGAENSIGIKTNTAPTCTAPVVFTSGLGTNGSVNYFISDDGYAIRANDAGEAELYVEHNWGEWTVTTPATCTEDGVETRECSVGHETETRPIEALGHDYVAVVTEPTCTEDGYTTHTCSRCGDSYTDNYVDALGHNFGDWTQTTAPTCTTAGEETRICSRCDAKETRPVAELGHSWKAPVWSWDGHASATATFVCERDENHKQILNAQIESEQGTGTDVGKTIYTATVVGPDDKTYTDVLKETNTYTVTWKNWNGDELEVDTNVPYGSTPSYDGAQPTRPQDAQYTYAFEGWDPVPGTVTGDVTYTATYTPTLRSYTITWLNEDGSQIDTTTVEYGTVPTHEAPTKQATAQYTYEFDGWDPAPVAVTGEATYKAKFRAVVNEYTVTFKNWDGEVLQSGKVPYGTVPSYSGTPTKAADAEYTYAFAGWSPEVTAVTGDATYTATYTATTRTYMVVWKNWDGEVLETDREVPYGTVPSYDGEEPTKEGDDQYTYTFTGWDPAVGAITSDTVYTAQFGEDVNTYTVTWVNWNGDELEVDTGVAYGATPKYDGATPTKASTAQFSYTFAGWTPAIAPVTGNITYTATFTETTRSYTIIWKNDDGQVLETDRDVLYGATPEYNGATPTKASTAQYSYEFAGWTPAVASVTGDATYTATYTATTRSYTVVWKNWNGDILEIDNNVLYGATPSYDSAEPTREGNAQYSYEFKGWTPEVTEVKGDAEYTAVFEEKTNTYSVTWKNWDGEVLKTDENVPYGTTPTYNGTQPTKAPDQTGHYSFTGWSPEVAAVSKDAVYTAVFAAEAHTYGEPEWVWTKTEDGYTASAVFACTHCGYRLTVLVEKPAYEVTKEPTTDEEGEGTYTATVKGPDGGTYTGTKVVEIAKLDGWHIIVTDYTKGAAATTINADALYRGENTFTATCAYDNDGEIIDAGCVIAIDNGDGTYTKLDVTTVNGVHSFTVNVMDADVRLVIVLKGDANLNGVVDTRDMTRIQNDYLEVPGKELTALQKLAADANGDGTADGKDMTRIQKSYLGMIVMPW